MFQNSNSDIFSWRIIYVSQTESTNNSANIHGLAAGKTISFAVRALESIKEILDFQNRGIFSSVHL